ncbi:hypothetical protein Cgig2_002640 [Carnegiea gigantea]|uniref:Gag-pol polyprotein n=1 Tax=Carnegiea gigantea TaxID=171969 RepID=A0A9Q1JJL2_9CARY|nr:hypothetical protein Cgig2_002640 [Carnegiea gigantea]
MAGLRAHLKGHGCQIRQGCFLILTTYPLLAASVPTGVHMYHPLIVLRGSRRRPGRTVVVDPMQGTTFSERSSLPVRTVTHFSEVRGHLMLWRPPPMIARPKPYHAQSYCKFHEQNGHTTVECCKLKKALHKLPNKGQIDRFLKKGPCFLLGEREPAQPQRRDEECSTEVVATITRGYAEGMTRSVWKAQLTGAKQVLMIEQGAYVTVSTMVFDGKETLRFASPHNDPLVVEMKIASAIIRRILIDTGSSMDIITWDCLNKLTYPGRDIVPLVHPILGFRG